MPSFPGSKQYHRDFLSRQAKEIKELLQALEMRNELNETVNRPLMDIYENDEAVILECDLPGFNPEDIHLRLAGLTLLLEADKPQEQPDGRFICMERSFGRFYYAIQLTFSVNPLSITAEYRLGVLRVICPKAGELRIPIKEITF